jgi:hypothetical protein
VIFGDDVGWMNVSSYGSDSMGVATPNIDRIGRGDAPVAAAEGEAEQLTMSDTERGVGA